MKKKICVIGLGYIGLPTAALFAKQGYTVVGIDKNLEVVKGLSLGKVIIEEPFLQDIVTEVINSGHLQVNETPVEADVFIIAVPTPIREDKTSDMGYVSNAAQSIVPYIRKGNIVVVESTSQVGATEEVVKPILEQSGLKIPEDVSLGYCPERVLPGKILKELVENDRVIGGIDKYSAMRIKEVYGTFVQGDMFLTTTKVAEMCKIMENTFRDVNIALANEMSMICEAEGINVWEVIRLSNKHPRVHLLNPGPGVGGHCLAVDPWFLVERYKELARIIKTSREINDGMPDYVYKKIEDILGILQGKKITILGMTYKPDIDDIRESPIVRLIKLLQEAGCELAIVDPFVKKKGYQLYELEEACVGSDLLVLGVNHKIFSDLPFSHIAKLMKGNIVLDTRNSLDEKVVEEAGLIYYVLGRGEYKSI